MSERMLVEYVLNAAWQVPVVGVAAWALLRLARLGPLGEHRVWLAVLGVCVLMPLGGIRQAARVEMNAPHQVLASVPMLEGRDAGSSAALWKDKQVGLRDALPREGRVVETPAPTMLRARVQRLEVSPWMGRIVAWGFAGVMLVGVWRLVLGWLGARRLVRGATAYVVEPAERLAWEQMASAMGARALPPVAWSVAVSSPLVVGIWQPRLLLPFDFWRCTPAERRAAISHELAHVARRDCLVHAVCQVAMLPLSWHPAMHGVGRSVARTREMVCDEMAARAMRSDVAYARCLLGLAERMLRGAQGNGLMAGMGLFPTNKLEERVMRLTEKKRTMSVGEAWLRRLAGGLALGLVVAVASGGFHLTPVLAQAAVPAVPVAPVVPPVPVTGEVVPPAEPAAVVMPEPPEAPEAPEAAEAAEAPEAPEAPETPSAPGGPLAPAPLPALAPLAPMAPHAPAPLAPELMVAPPAPLPPLAPVPAAPVLMNAPNGAHGRGVQVLLGDGAYVHHWTASDGRRMELRNDQKADPTPEQKAKIEAEVKHDMAQAKLEMGRAQESIAKARAQINSPELRRQMADARQSMAAVQLEMRRSQAQMTLDLEHARETMKRESARMNGTELRKQIADAVAQVNLPELRKQIAEATAPLQTAEVQKRIAEAAERITSFETLKAIAGAEAQVNSPELQRRLDDAEKKLAEAMKELDEAQKPQ